MNNNIITAALLFSATPIVLTACTQKDPQERLVEIFEEMNEIMTKATPENVDDMIKKVKGMQEEAQEIKIAIGDKKLPDGALKKRREEAAGQILGLSIGYTVRWKKSKDSKKMEALIDEIGKVVEPLMKKI